MQADRKRNLCDYTLNSSDESSDSDSGHQTKLQTAKNKEKSNDSSSSDDIRDELLESGFANDKKRQSESESAKHKQRDKDKSSYKRKRSRSRSRDRGPGRRDHSRDRYHHRSPPRGYRDNYSRRNQKYDRRNRGPPPSADRKPPPKSNVAKPEVVERDFAKTAGKGFDQVLARQKQQLEKRKLLWQGHKEKKVADHWGGMLAACSDDKQAAKLKKLIGLRGDGSSSPTASGSTSGEQTLQKQEAIFRSLDQQYEMARVSTHTHRGVGLGFTTQMNEYWAHIHQAPAATAEMPKNPPR